MSLNESLDKLRLIDRECRHLERVVALLQWDQETYLPARGVGERADQLALMEGLLHTRLTSAETGRLLGELGSVPDNPKGDEKLSALDRDFLKVLRRNYDRALKLPLDFVSEAARAEGLSQAAWVKARKENRFEDFLPHLTKMIDLSCKRAHYWGYKDNCYDGLLDIYEPGMGVDEISRLFNPLGERLSRLIKRISSESSYAAKAAGDASPKDASFLNADFDPRSQAAFASVLMERLGFDKSRGRIDVSAHPFCTTLGSDDIRITSRYLERQICSGIFSVIHESGHAFYELGFPKELRGSCLADGASMGIHESQSRLWENVIGRSRPFCLNLFPLLKEHFPDKMAGTCFDDFYRAINRVEASLIRVEADEVSYSLHIILRFELEKALFQGTLDPAALPELWRSKMKEYLGIEPQSDDVGVLQDIHWSMGGFGYFPSYALGNLYGLQFWEKLISDIPSIEEDIARGHFKPVHDWLGDNIFVWGRRLEPGELLKKVTGNSISFEPFLNYIETKYTGLYEIQLLKA